MSRDDEMRAVLSGGSLRRVSRASGVPVATLAKRRKHPGTMTLAELWALEDAGFLRLGGVYSRRDERRRWSGPPHVRESSV
jgi:hypothetical protein